jgi:hypothetical protein
MRVRHRRRPAFTLLEVLLAAAIGVLLLGALYVAVDLHLKQTEAGRDAAAQADVARRILARVAADITPCVGPRTPQPQPSQGGQGGGQGGGTGGGQAAGTTGTTNTTGTTPSTTGMTGGTSGTPSPSSSSPSSISSGLTTGTATFSVQGDSVHVSVFISRLPREAFTNPTGGANANPLNGADPNAPVVSDLRKITYWLAGGDNNPLGLARQEVKLVTSDEALDDSLPDNEADFVVAEEVKSLGFSYYDGNEWQDSWDGTTLGPDGMTPIGPPLAIAITVGMALPDADADPDNPPPLRQYRHVVAIPTANGSTQSTTGGTTP